MTFRIEGLLAMNILCTASEAIIDVLHLVQSLASGSTKHYLDESGETPVNQSSKSTRECSSKHSASVTPTDTKREVRMESKKGTRFTLPGSAEKSLLHNGKKWSSCDSDDKTGGEKKSVVKTLNILGMQPDFSESLAGSIGQTLTQTGTVNSEALTVSADKQGEGDNPENKEDQFNEPSSSDVLLQSVRTQSLIENESIPETPPSQYSSNTTVLDLGSSTTLEAALSRSKSVGLLASSHDGSKDFLVSNVLSTGDLPAVGEEHSGSVSSLIPVQRKLVSPVSGLLADYGTSTKHSEELPTVHEVASTESSHQNAQANIPQQVSPAQYQGVESRYSHYTHSTAPLSGGAGVPGSQVPPSTIYRRSTLSTPATELPIIESSVAFANSSKFENWPNEVALVYTLNMASVVIFGRSSLVQKVALEGMERETSKNQQLNPPQKYGLMQLVDFVAKSGLESDPTKCGKCGIHVKLSYRIKINYCS